MMINLLVLHLHKIRSVNDGSCCREHTNNFHDFSNTIINFSNFNDQAQYQYLNTTPLT